MRIPILALMGAITLLSSVALSESVTGQFDRDWGPGAVHVLVNGSFEAVRGQEALAEVAPYEASWNPWWDGATTLDRVRVSKRGSVDVTEHWQSYDYVGGVELNRVIGFESTAMNALRKKPQYSSAYPVTYCREALTYMDEDVGSLLSNGARAVIRKHRHIEREWTESPDLFTHITRSKHLEYDRVIYAFASGSIRPEVRAWRPGDAALQARLAGSMEAGAFLRVENAGAWIEKTTVDLLAGINDDMVTTETRPADLHLSGDTMDLGFVRFTADATVTTHKIYGNAKVVINKTAGPALAALVTIPFEVAQAWGFVEAAPETTSSSDVIQQMIDEVLGANDDEAPPVKLLEHLIARECAALSEQIVFLNRPLPVAVSYQPRYSLR